MFICLQSTAAFTYEIVVAFCACLKITFCRRPRTLTRTFCHSKQWKIKTKCCAVSQSLLHLAQQSSFETRYVKGHEMCRSYNDLSFVFFVLSFSGQMCFVTMALLRCTVKTSQSKVCFFVAIYHMNYTFICLVVYNLINAHWMCKNEGCTMFEKQWGSFIDIALRYFHTFSIGVLLRTHNCWKYIFHAPKSAFKILY